MSGEQVVQAAPEQLALAVKEGISVGLLVFGPLGLRFTHKGEDGAVHDFPRPTGCDICGDILSLRLDALAEEDVSEALEALDAKILGAAIRSKKHPGGTKGFRSGHDEIKAALLEDDPKSLEQLMERSFLSRAAVMRQLRVLGVKAVIGSGRGRTKALYTLRPSGAESQQS